jgi:hypothetical protein
MSHRLLILWWIALLGIMPAARGQSAPTAPVDVPAESDLAQDQTNLDLKHSLDTRHADLLQRFQAWNTQAQTYNSQYASRDLDPDSSEYAAGQAMLSHLSSDLSSYNDDNAAFAADVARLVPRPPPQPPIPKLEEGVKVSDDTAKVPLSLDESMPGPAADLVNLFNAVAHKLKLPSGPTQDHTRARKNCQAFFRGVADSLSQEGKVSWRDDFNGLVADGIAKKIEADSANGKNWEKIKGSTPQEIWKSAQDLANKGVIIVGAMPADSSGDGHLGFVFPVPDGLKASNFSGSGPFVRDGNEHWPQGRDYPSTYGAVKASKAFQMNSTSWYIWAPSKQ